MKSLKNLEESVAYNQRSLKRLVRSITLSQGQFSLILVCCNYHYLQQTMMAELRKLSSVEIQELVLPKSVKTLYTTIDKELEKSPDPSALMIFELEKVEAIDELLTSTNQVRDEFRKNFSFPLVLWIKDELLAKLIRLAPDFKSWAAATIKFEFATDELIDLLRIEVESYLIYGWENQQQTIYDFSLKSASYKSLPNDSIVEPVSSWFDGLCRSKRQEIELALNDLESRGQEIEAILKANIEFILGRDDYCNEKIDSAIAHYQESLRLWQKKVRKLCYLEQEYISSSIIDSKFILEKQGIVLYDLGLCYHLKFLHNPVATGQELERAKLILQKSKQIFEKVNRFDLVGEVISTLEQVIKHMKAWEDLATLAEEGINIHLKYGNDQQVALDYGFLAEVALERSNWYQALIYSEKALHTLFYAKNITLPTAKNSYLLLLAKSLREIGRQPEAIEYLQIAETTEKDAIQNGLKNQESRDPKLYLEILTELRSLYYEQGKYLEAFRLKKTKRQIAHQYGLLAFIGASQLQPQKQTYIKESLDYEKNLPEEITASSRQKDINNLLERISRNDHKLTIIHGRSGVGKSSLVNAGLVPALNNISISARDTIPVVVQVYTDWLGELEKCLQKVLSSKVKNLEHQNIEQNQEKIKSLSKNQKYLSLSKEESDYGVDICNPTAKTNIISSYSSNQSDLEAGKFRPYLREITDEFKDVAFFIISQLKYNAEQNLLTVIIFDQFEEFFFTSNTREEREVFYTFLRDCLNLPFVKVILSMREDYLHYLLECDFIDYLDIINNNILDKQIRYHVTDFSREDAYTIIECLKNRSKLNLESKLIDFIVDGLADEKQKIRPIELQVVGSQLQEEKPVITTLAQFEQKFGTNPQKAKEKIVREFLEQVIKDCGKENEETTMQILFALTNDNLTRHTRTKAELSEIILNSPLQNLPTKKTSEKLLFTKLTSGNQVNKQIQNQLDLILEILIDSGILFVRKESLETQYQLVHDYLVQPIRQRFNLEERLRQAEAEIQQAEIAKKQAEAEKVISKSQLNTVLKRQLAAAIVGIVFMSGSTITTLGFWQRTKVQKEVAKAQKERADINSMTAVSEALFFSNYRFDALIESLRAGKKWKNLKQKLDENYLSNDTKYRIAASLQQAVYGVKEYNNLEGHSDVIWSVTFNPQGNLIASASVDKTIKLWSHHGKLEKTLKGHTGSVSRVNFSPDGNYLASASHDRTVKIWYLKQEEIKPLSLKSHTDLVTTVNFSPNGKILASGSLDKTIKIWSKTGLLLRIINTKAVINWVSFSPDGQIIAAATDNGTVQLWNLNGNLLATLQHNKSNNHQKVYSVNFSPDGRSLVTASEDKTVKIWRFSETTSGNIPILERTITGHKKFVLSANFSPDGKTIASSSAENTIKIWSLEGTLLKTFYGHGDMITQVSFSPDGQTLASSSYDKTIKLWNLKSSSLNILQGHQHRVLAVNFSRDSKILASASQNNNIKLWSRTGKLLKTLWGHTDRVVSVSFSPDGQILASGSYDNTVKLWYFNSPEKIWNSELLNSARYWRRIPNYLRDYQYDSTSGEKISYMVSQTEFTESLQNNKWRHCELLAEKRLMAVFNRFCPQENYEFYRLRPLTKFTCLLKVAGNLCLLPSDFSRLPQLNSLSQNIFFAQKKNTIFTNTILATSKLPCFSTELGKSCSDLYLKPKTNYHPTVKKIDLIGHTDSVMGVSFSPNGQIIASASKDKTVKLWKRNGKLFKTLVGHQEWVNSVSFSPDGKMLASASDDGTVKVWTSDGVLLRTINAHNNWVLDVSFSPNGQAIATASYDNTVKLWSINGKLIKTFLKGASDSVTSVSFSPDGQIIAASSYDGKVKLWSLYDGTLLKTLIGHEDSVMSVSFSPDGQLLASGSRDKRVILWNLALDDLLVRACNLVGDYLDTNPNVSDNDRSLCQN
ncbi:MAG: hypothetical protein QNJ68_15010 [Microcoleaceae cyanobacterium MO_207.B10]|nr:hypothetical protein [Microcoleaceae cyanobacterium MO_207.B10]